MDDVISTLTGSGRPLFAASIACFAVAGVATGAVDSLAATTGATAIAIGGVYALARYARAVTRRTLAVAALGCWIAFLSIAAVHAVGLETAAGIAPGPAETIVLAITALTWGTLLSAVGTTAFLGFREYGSRAGTDVPEEQILDGETTSDY